MGSKLRILPVIGPPGAGKSTALMSLAGGHSRLARFGVRDYGLHLAGAGHSLGLRMRGPLLRGELLSDDLVQQEFAHFLGELPGEVTAVAVEGYPRDLRQCDDLAGVAQSCGARLAELIVVDVPDDTVWGRVRGRRICRGCGRPAPHDAVTCSSCGGPVAGRPDDAEDLLIQRLRDFRVLSATIRPYFEQRHGVHLVDGLQGPDEVRRRLKSLLLPAGEEISMADPVLETMRARREALDAMADLPALTGGEGADFRLDLRGFLGEDGLSVPPARLVAAICDRVVRDDGTGGQGAAVVTGLSHHFDLPAARQFHEELFRRVWDQVRQRSGVEGSGNHRIKVSVTSDGAIPPDLYGSRWSFKRLHMDRDALLFSHLYGPVAGFSGGSLLLADVRAFMRRHGLRFADLFEWSNEPTPGSKPVLRVEHAEKVLAECGLDLGPLGPDAIVFVNNLPSAGVLHGVTPVVVDAASDYIREYHRCSVKAVP